MDQSSPRYVQYERDHYEQLFYFIDNAIEDVIKEQETEVFLWKVEWIKKITCDGCKQRDGLKQAKERRKSYSANDSIKQVKPSLHRITFKTDENQTIVEEEDEERYQQVQSNHSEKHNIVLTDPVYCNPNSMETVARVLRKIGTENGIVRYGGTKREWTFVCCDGLPFMICKKLKEEAVICIEPDCKKKFLTRKEFTLHADQEHPDAKNCQFMYEFDWFYLRIGAGHYEMNLLKAFFELNWIPFLEVLCEKMGFLSDAAKMYAKACKDTHKSWHLLMVFHTSGLRELVIPYVRNCMVNGKTPEAKEFFHFTQTMYSEENSNLKYLMDTVCRFSQGIINYRMGVRRNNAQLMKSAKYMTKELFSARSHPKYQAIEVFDTLQDILMPIEVSKLNDKYSSFSTTGNKSLGEDADFVLEEKNRQLKSWIPKGIPRDLIWQSVCRNNEVLEKVKGNCLNLFRVQNSQGKTKPVNLEEAIMEFRTAIRKDRYLQKYGVHTSLSGLILDGDLVNLMEGATKRRMFYLRSEILGEGIEAPALRHPVPVTIEERLKFNSVNSMNLNEIKKEISELLELIQDPLVQDYHEKLYNTEVKGKVKARHVQFLQELKEAMSGNDGNSTTERESCSTEEPITMITGMSNRENIPMVYGPGFRKKLKPGKTKPFVSKKQNTQDKIMALRASKSRNIKNLKKIAKNLQQKQIYEPVECLFIVYSKGKKIYKYFGTGHMVNRFEKGQPLAIGTDLKISRSSKDYSFYKKNKIKSDSFLTQNKYRFNFTEEAGKDLARR
ncbi:unnamed protein product [Mytilus coruscus]|uniref:C2H2-type domain-containing protein n=1 Tax=Mytilus coruscus TaxID=42192 RepID=A0A6J8C843_MYTCO|nr:unnamed protein product [Mytilus coruscus]